MLRDFALYEQHKALAVTQIHASATFLWDHELEN